MLQIYSWYNFIYLLYSRFFSAFAVKGITCAARFVFGFAAYNAVVYHLTQSVVICAQKRMK